MQKIQKAQKNKTIKYNFYMTKIYKRIYEHNISYYFICDNNICYITA
jgi:hypothetical protein